MNATTQLETVDVTAEKLHGLGNQQPSACNGEGSTTRAQARRVQVDPKCPEPQKVCKTCGQSKPVSQFHLHSNTGKPRAHCKSCLYRHQRDYARRNPELVRSVSVMASRKFRARHPETVSAAFAVWRDSRKDALNQRSREWRQGNRASVLHYKAKHRAWTRRQTPSWADVNAIKAIYAEAIARKMVVDHVVPLRGKRVSGLHVEYNLRLLTNQENARKYNKFLAG